MELLVFFVFQDITAYLILIGILTHHPESIEEDHDHPKQAPQVCESHIKAGVGTIILVDDICLFKVDLNELISAKDLRVTNHRALDESQPFLSFNVSDWLRPYRIICIDLVLSEEHMAVNPHLVSELEVGSILKNVIQIFLLAGIDDRVGKVGTKLECSIAYSGVINGLACARRTIGAFF